MDDIGSELRFASFVMRDIRSCRVLGRKPSLSSHLHKCFAVEQYEPCVAGSVRSNPKIKNQGKVKSYQGKFFNFHGSGGVVERIRGCYGGKYFGQKPYLLPLRKYNYCLPIFKQRKKTKIIKSGLISQNF